MMFKALFTRPYGYRLLYSKSYSTNTNKFSNLQSMQRRNDMFSKEMNRQQAHITRIEKIQVSHRGPPEDCNLIMNKGLSTPFNCAMHIKELLMDRSVLALVNGQPWDMHRPLQEDCTLEFLHFKDEDSQLVNETFWRSCSFILGHVLETAFKDEHYVELCSFPKPNIRSGSFVYDADLKLPNWHPTGTEMRCLGRIGAKLSFEDYKFERLEVDASVAQDMFENNRFKSEQIPSIAARSPSGNTVTLYRMGSHVDISQGPLIANTQLIGRFDVAAVHDIQSPDFGALKRVQGIAIPRQFYMHYYVFEFLKERAAKLNKAQMPRLYFEHERRQIADI